MIHPAVYVVLVSPPDVIVMKAVHVYRTVFIVYIPMFIMFERTEVL